MLQDWSDKHPYKARVGIDCRHAPWVGVGKGEVY